jgi:peptidyl-prolyl cis-trans isomerase B (cyclophilin B)
MRKFILFVTLFFTFQSFANAQNPVVLLNTSVGTIEIELFQQQAPESVKNFLNYVDQKFYDGLIFHRVIDQFMIQGGGLTKDLSKKMPTQKPIKNEANNGLKNEIGTIAMARTSDVHSATSQFFINVANNSFLDFKNESDVGYGYAVFGKVVKGMDIVNKIKSVKTVSKSGLENLPEVAVEIKQIKRK